MFASPAGTRGSESRLRFGRCLSGANTRNRLPSCSSRPGHGEAGEEESEGESAQWVGLALRLAGGWSVACFHFVLFLKGFKTRLLNGILSALPLPSLLSHTHHRNGCHRANV